MSLPPNLPDPSTFTLETRRTLHKSPSIGELSIIQRGSTTVEVCGHDTTFPSFLGTSEFFYDPRAGTVSDRTGVHPPIERVIPRYENPLITATSRALISDIYALTRCCRAVDVPRPLSLLHALMRARPPNTFEGDPWFKALRVWAEVDDISETESFDGHKKSFVQYTTNVLFFPDLHTTYKMPATLMLRHPPSSPADSPLSLSVPASPYLPIPGTLFSVPSPLHFQLPVMTQLCFNEQGQITYHRDVWDVRDVVRLIPGVRVALWIIARAGAWGLSWISRRVCSNMVSDTQHDESMNGDNALLETTVDARD